MLGGFSQQTMLHHRRVNCIPTIFMGIPYWIYIYVYVYIYIYMYTYIYIYIYVCIHTPPIYGDFKYFFWHCLSHMIDIDTKNLDDDDDDDDDDVIIFSGSCSCSEGMWVAKSPETMTP